MTRLLFFLVLFSFILCACTTFKYSNGYLLKSINVGVLKGTRVAGWASHIRNEDNVAFNVLYANEKNLMESVKDGNVDILVGLPVTQVMLSNKLWSTDPVEVRQFDFFVRSNDARKLHEYLFLRDFIHGVKKIGYASLGEQGVVNRLVLKEINISDKFFPCGSLSKCLSMLANEQIDSLFADEKLLKKHQLRSKPITLTLSAAGFGYKQSFSFLVNQRSLSEQDFDRLNKIVY